MATLVRLSFAVVTQPTLQVEALASLLVQAVQFLVAGLHLLQESTKRKLEVLCPWYRVSVGQTPAGLSAFARQILGLMVFQDL
jgi:hypothetical protein